MERTRSSANWRGQPLDGILLDLDGTLLDTAADITRALNRAIAEHGWAPLPVSEVARMIGRGSPILIERASVARGHVLTGSEQAALVDRFFDYYGALEESNESDALPYPGVRETLQILHEARLPTAVVTNKQHRFASALLHRLELSAWVDVIVGGDTCKRRKPDPEPLLFACESLHVPPSRALMIGDSVNDVKAARAAGIPIVCVPYGYNEGQDPRTLECDAMVDTLADLPALLWR